MLVVALDGEFRGASSGKGLVVGEVTVRSLLRQASYTSSSVKLLLHLPPPRTKTNLNQNPHTHTQRHTGRASPESLEAQDHLVNISKIWRPKIFFFYKLGVYLHKKISKNFWGPRRMFHWAWPRTGPGPGPALHIGFRREDLNRA